MPPRTSVLLAVAATVPGVTVWIGYPLMSLSDAAATGDEVQALEQLRDDLAMKLDACESLRDYAALSLRFMDTVKRITELKGEKPVSKGSVLDELSKRRSARGAGT
ncbi:MAG: hypothetical protein ACTIJ6_05385 [Leucobacter sp.]